MADAPREPPVLLALETSGGVGSVALSLEGDVVTRDFLHDRRGHASELIPAVHRVLAAAGVSRRSLSGVVVGSGPGSFTGLRVAAAAGKGLAHALSIPLYAVSSLTGAALTEIALPEGAGPWSSSDPPPRRWGSGERHVLFDARGDRLFAAAFRIGSESVEILRSPEFLHLDQLLQDDDLVAVPLCGSGAVRHRERLEAAGRRVFPAPAGAPSADGLLHALALQHEPRPVADPYGWEPDYLRASNAERSGGG